MLTELEKEYSNVKNKLFDTYIKQLFYNMFKYFKNNYNYEIILDELNKCLVLFYTNNGIENNSLKLFIYPVTTETSFKIVLSSILNDYQVYYDITDKNINDIVKIIESNYYLFDCYQTLLNKEIEISNLFIELINYLLIECECHGYKLNLSDNSLLLNISLSNMDNFEISFNNVCHYSFSIKDLSDNSKKIFKQNELDIKKLEYFLERNY